ncbi:MAG: 3',5'-cyclic-AMP phosphodiesterase [Pseudomonadales bacterium]|jgi:Icc protein|nr:3',5'-cyclic-AMP phosphodiesterase [Gammaproteobacteria bacterium]MBP6053200.1 3',5'-cyclic-AMP phosphodiesterase [Pseudomonadales bacterium]MBK6582707.1 3',5'-cyclic-AMP phosphodiesterase [Gammaproteobacteria bacterium]MBK7167977.1 3',5'-cyclic-AMP phosphodiesterase [Gammaproteobacteria bacterium]MBK7518837.1 3',5'-cyclic-AMP phosphodiesterase [Gammaproteobacteria bacterium]
MVQQRFVVPRNAGRVRVAQITDTHLEERDGGTLLGLDTDASMEHVLRLLGTGEQRPDLILATGDLANHGSRAAYERLRRRFDALGIPWLWLPGNHDDAGQMCVTLGDGAPMTRSVLVGGWHIVLLDSTIPGAVGGRLGVTELQLLDQLLALQPASPTLVCLHHQPVAIGCAWLDEQMIEDAPALFEMLAPHAQVRALLWGHVHQEFARQRGTLQLLAAPSTCVQFAPDSVGFRVDELAPGMRWLELRADGGLETRIERVQGVIFPIDRDSAGYL